MTGERDVAIYRVPTLSRDDRRLLADVERGLRDLPGSTSGRPRWRGSVRKAAVHGDEYGPGGLREPVVRSYQRAMTRILQLAGGGRDDVTTLLLRSLHYLMTEHDPGASPGRWRRGPVLTRNVSTGAVTYQPPPAGDVPDLMEALVAQVNDPSDHPLVVAAMAHLNLVTIHPFRDGNGRMSRCLQAFVLVRAGISGAEGCSIEEHLGRNTGAYYDVLHQVGGTGWDPGRDAGPWVRFCLEAHRATLAGAAGPG